MEAVSDTAVDSAYNLSEERVRPFLETGCRETAGRRENVMILSEQNPPAT